MTKEELEKEAKEKYFNHEMMDFQGFYNYHYYFLGYLDSAEPREKRIAELEKENAELDCQKNRNKACYSCANATERCFKNEIGCPCEKYKSYKDENAELKNRNSELADQKASLERWYGEAKKILTKLLEEEKNNMYWEMNGSDKSSYYEVRKQAEQFLNEVEKCQKQNIFHFQN